MGTGIGASLITFSPDTTIASAQANSNFAALDSGGLANDGGNITTDGAGNFTFGGRLTSGGVAVFDATGYDTYVASRGSANVVHFLTGTTEVGSFSGSGLAIKRSNASTPSPIICGIALGIKNNNGVALFEIKSNGNAVVSGQYTTTGSTATIATGATFDGFDYAEVYPCDRYYPGGTVVCPSEQDEGVLTRCTHDACHAALIVSSEPGSTLGGAQLSCEQGILAIALCGRINVATQEEVRSRALLCSDGAGGVRQIRAGEQGHALGFALNASAHGSVGMMLRPLFISSSV